MSLTVPKQGIEFFNKRDISIHDQERFNNLRKKISSRSFLLLGVSDYLPHLLVNYLDLWAFCFYCGDHLTYETATIEHLLPTSQFKGSINKPKVLSCAPCNSARSSRDLAEYLTSDRLIVDSNRAGFHFYKHFPQNSFEYVGLRIPPEISSSVLKVAEFGLLG